MGYPSGVSASPSTPARFPHLTNAPIFEAVVELRVSGVTAGKAERGFDEVANALASDFPARNPIKFVAPHFKFSLEDDDAATESRVERGVIGMQLVSADKKFVVHAKKDGLVVSRRAPYTTWDDLRGWVRVVLPLYLHHLAPTAIGRIGVRYINHIALPPKTDTDTIFTAGPKIPSALPQSFLDFATRVVVPMVEYDAAVAIVQGVGLPPPAGGPKDTATLDIDAYTVGEPFDPAAPERLWERMEHLHIVKNVAFFSALHEKVWRQFE
jgi:uncharacterized protein (TIGR04255 family)